MDEDTDAFEDTITPEGRKRVADAIEEGLRQRKEAQRPLSYQWIVDTITDQCVELTRHQVYPTRVVVSMRVLRVLMGKMGGVPLTHIDTILFGMVPIEGQNDALRDVDVEGRFVAGEEGEAMVAHRREEDQLRTIMGKNRKDWTDAELLLVRKHAGV